MVTSASVGRIVILVLAVVAFWCLGHFVDGMPSPRGAEAPPAEFSAARADATLGRLLGPEVPHPISTPANAAVRDRVRTEFAGLGIKTTVYRATGCNARPNYGLFGCGTVEDIIADVLPGEGKAIVLMAHYDSVPAGPGAGDDLSGVATILETVRALRARGLHTKHPVVALITDGEEAGLLGAEAFVADPALKARVGMALNFEARGSAGPTLLIQTGGGDSARIDLYAHSLSAYSASSLMEVVYKLLPNDTDFTPFLNAGLTGYNFAFIDQVSHYHTPLDSRALLDRSALQDHGDKALGLSAALMQTDFAALQGSDAIYLSLLGRVLPRMPASWALPLALLTAVLLLVAAFLSRGDVLGIGRRLAAFAIPLLAIVGSAAMGWLLHLTAAAVSGQPDPSFAHPVWLRAALGLGVLAVLLSVSPLARARLTALSVWGWIAALAVVTAALLPGLSPYFLFPALIGSTAILAQATLRGAWTGPAGEAALLVAALPALLIWLPLAALAETVQGLLLHPLVTLPVAIGAMTLLPFLAARPLPRRTALTLAAASAVAALLLAAASGFLPAYSAAAPQQINLTFVDDHVAGRSVWAAETGATLPSALRAAMDFSADRVAATPISFQKAYVAPAGAVRFAAPTATVATVPHGAGRVVTLTLHGSPQADRMALVVPKDAGLLAAAIDGHVFRAASDTLNPFGTLIACVTADCRSKTVTLTFANRRPLEIVLGEQRYGLPPGGARLLAARSGTAVPSRTGDTTIVFAKLRLP